MMHENHHSKQMDHVGTLLTVKLVQFQAIMSLFGSALFELWFDN